MAAQIRAGRLSAREVMQAHLARIEAVNPRVNAIVTLHAEQAMAAALAADEAQAEQVRARFLGRGPQSTPQPAHFYGH